MRVSKETLNRGRVGMGWWVSGLLLGAYNNTTTHQHLFPCSAMRVSERTLYYDRGEWVGAQEGGV